MSDRSVFVTGGTGFVGSHLVDELLARGVAEVRCLVRNKLKWLEGKPVTVIKGGLEDLDVLRMGCDGAHFVVHVGGLTKAFSPEEYRRANVDGTRNLLTAAAGVGASAEHVLLTSSLAAVGAADVSVATETTPLNPISDYGKSKAEMEQAALDWAGRLRISIVRPPAVYGPRDTDVLLFFKSLDRGLFVVPESSAGQDFSLVHVKDLVRGMADCLFSEHGEFETYFIGSEKQYSWTEVRDTAAQWYSRSFRTLRVPNWVFRAAGAGAEAVGAITGRPQIFDREKATEILHGCKICSVEKAKTQLGYRQRVSLEEGVRDTISWYRSRGMLRPDRKIGVVSESN